MTIFSLNYKPRKAEDRAAINDVMEAWAGEQVAETVWILKRNDGCTCQTIVDDLQELMATECEVTVVEIGQKCGKAAMGNKTAEQDALNWSQPTMKSVATNL